MTSAVSADSSIPFKLLRFYLISYSVLYLFLTLAMYSDDFENERVGKTWIVILGVWHLGISLYQIVLGVYVSFRLWPVSETGIST